MTVDRATLYRLPWTRTDNPGGWIEVTDACDLRCPGCYRHRIGGHRALAELEEEVRTLRRLTNCDRVAIAGGEPLLYPRIVDVVRMIADQGLKAVLLTHGGHLTPELGRELQRAGLAKFHFHVDSGMQRPGWEGRTEGEMNELRQHFVDLVRELDGVQCGFNITITPDTVHELPRILEWARHNIHTVQHLSLIAFRSIPIRDDTTYTVGGRPVDVTRLQHASAELDRMGLTTEAMLETLQSHDPGFHPSTYLPGTSAPATHKFLVAVQVGTARGHLGYLGARTQELVQVGHHLLTGRYCSFLRNPKIGLKLLLLTPIDGQLRGVARRLARRPWRLLEPIYTQSVSLQQPNEMLDGRANLCDGCLNMMLHDGVLIPSCRLDEYRLFGGAVEPVIQDGEGRAGTPATSRPGAVAWNEGGTDASTR